MERQELYDAWLERQAPAPVAEADVQEEDLARSAHSRLRGWAKTLVDASELHAEIVRRELGKRSLFP